MSTTAQAAAHETGLPPKVDAWSPGSNAVGASCPTSSAPIGNPFASPFASVSASGFTPTRSHAKNEPHAADAGLHLVEDQQRAVLVRERARLRERLRTERVHAAFALHDLEQDRGRVRPDVIGERLGRRERHAGHERLERGPLRGLARDRERADRAAVERPFQRHEPGTTGRLARPLERRLDRLGAGVAEERVRAAEAVGELRGELEHRLGVVEVRRVPHAVELGVRGRERRRVAVPEPDDGDPAEQVEVALAVRVDEPCAVALDPCHVLPRVRRQEIVMSQHLLLGHATTAVLPISALMPLPAASAAARSLGTIPPSNAPSSSMRVACPAPIESTRSPST